LLAFLSPTGEKGPLESVADGARVVGEAALTYGVLQITYVASKNSEDRAQLELLGAQLGAQFAKVLAWSSAQLAAFSAALKKTWPQLRAQARKSFSAWLQTLLTLLPAGSSEAAVRQSLDQAEKSYPHLTEALKRGPSGFVGEESVLQLGERLRMLHKAYPSLPRAYLGELGRFLISGRVAALSSQWSELTAALLAQPDGPAAPKNLKKMQASLNAMRKINAVLASYLNKPLINDLPQRQAALDGWTTQSARVPASNPTPAGARERDEKARRLDEAKKLATDIARKRVGNPGLLSGKTPSDIAQEAVTALKEKGRTSAATLAQSKLPKATAGPSWPAAPSPKPELAPNADVQAAQAIMQTDAQGHFVVSLEKLNDWIAALALHQPEVAAAPLVADAYALRRLASVNAEELLRTAPDCLQAALRMPMYPAPTSGPHASLNATPLYLTQDELQAIPLSERHRVVLPPLKENTPYAIRLNGNGAADVIESILRQHPAASFAFRKGYLDPQGDGSVDLSLEAQVYPHEGSGTLLIDPTGNVIAQDDWLRGRESLGRVLSHAIDATIPDTDSAGHKAVYLTVIIDRALTTSGNAAMVDVVLDSAPQFDPVSRAHALQKMLQSASPSSRDGAFSLLHHAGKSLNNAAMLMLVHQLNTGTTGSAQAYEEMLLRHLLLTQLKGPSGAQFMQSLRMSDADCRATLERYGIHTLMRMAPYHPQMRAHLSAYIKKLLANDRAQLQSQLKAAKDLSALGSLEGMNFSAFNFDGMKLSQLDLRGVNFNQTSLEKTDLRGANLTGATFVGSLGRPLVDPDQLSPEQRSQLRLLPERPARGSSTAN
jgi:hypothetical protein